MESGTITAILGPTNTGKTHRALTRMMGHRTGMIGLPLRLLAREVYDRVARERGAALVALVTGEERILPPTARYFVCTVESMPTDRDVDCLVVDEIQLAADPFRGHVFTDRLLHARGRRETLFLGSATMAPMIERLLPHAHIESHPRLSKLTFSGYRKVASLQSRSAVVAFSAERVYSLAERLRARHGGVAVVLGALSPRARNAQVAMYQAGEVRHLVATDAIGLGLNLDLTHVALADRAKYDGRSARALRSDEIAQIAGRAGRYTRDGTFGTTDDCAEISAEEIAEIEEHRFAPITRLTWRNADLDWGSPDGLLASLDQGPRRPWFVAPHAATDREVVGVLLRRPDILGQCKNPESLRLLWEVCQVPDFSATRGEHHAGLCATLFDWLSHHGEIPQAKFSEQITRLDRIDGGIENLTTRLAGIRTWSYVTWRGGWLRDARAWQDRTREIEDRLSDALHAALTARFVDRTASVLLAEDVGQRTARVDADGRVLIDGRGIGVIRGLTFVPASEALPRAAWEVIRKATRPILNEAVHRFCAGGVDAVVVDGDGAVRWEGGLIGRLTAGVDLLKPKLTPAPLDSLGEVERGLVVRRLDRLTAEWVAAHFGDPPAGSGPLAALAFGLRQGLGVGTTALLAGLDPSLRPLLLDVGVTVGRRFVWDARMLNGTDVKVPLVAAFLGQPVPSPDGRAHPWATASSEAWKLLGFCRVGNLAVRVDLWEAVAGGGRPQDATEELHQAMKY